MPSTLRVKHSRQAAIKAGINFETERLPILQILFKIWYILIIEKCVNLSEKVQISLLFVGERPSMAGLSQSSLRLPNFLEVYFCLTYPYLYLLEF